MALIKMMGNNGIDTDMWKLEPSSIADGNVKWHCHFGTWFISFSKVKPGVIM